MEQSRPTQCVSAANDQLPDDSLQNSLEDLREILSRAGSAQQAWADTPVKQRARAILRVRDYVS